MTYLELLKEHHSQKRSRYCNVLKSVPAFSELEDYELLLLTDALAPMQPAEGTVLMKQGNVGEDFFGVLEGECEILIRQDDVEKEVSRLTTGAFFGEIAPLWLGGNVSWRRLMKRVL